MLISLIDYLEKEKDDTFFINRIKLQMYKLYNQLSAFDYIPTFAFLDILQKQNIFVFIIDEQIVGTITVLLERKMIHNGGMVAHIEDVVVDENHRNKKIGSQLIEHAIQFAKSKNCYKTILNCTDDKTTFYEKCGFTSKNKEMCIYF